MSGDDGTYAPRSPDFSSLQLYSTGPTENAPQQALQPSRLPEPEIDINSYKSADNTNHFQHQEYSYWPRSSSIAPSFHVTPPPSHTQEVHRQQPHQHQHQQPRHDQFRGYPPPPTLQSQSPDNYTSTQPLTQPLAQPRRSSIIASNIYDRPQSLSSIASNPPADGYQYGLHAAATQPALPPSPHYPPSTPYRQPYQQPTWVSPASPNEQPNAQLYSPPQGGSANTMPPRRAPPPPPPVIEPSPVKTKFPTARIKRIMQADEEVGKVAQQTPIAVGKALELFMIQMVSKSAEVAKEKGSKRVTAAMLKTVVEEDDQWDFLREIVGRVESEKEGSKARAKVESSSDEEMSEPKKRTRGGRKKKV
ncbi:hypothetical protein G7046_g4176 [Stylonectria norvegica]|nr:hypothetical protein G7046_g4176 [Stylonectria norvegica]